MVVGKYNRVKRTDAKIRHVKQLLLALHCHTTSRTGRLTHMVK